MMTKKELRQLEMGNADIPLLDILYVVVSNRKHDSGYKMYEIYGVAYNRCGNDYKKCLSKCSDVINFSVLEGLHNINVDSKETNLFRFFLDGNYKFQVKGTLSSFIVDIVRVR